MSILTGNKWYNFISLQSKQFCHSLLVKLIIDGGCKNEWISEIAIAFAVKVDNVANEIISSPNSSLQSISYRSNIRQYLFC
ncbi:unnamed protein product [Trifolium pratense]|uniref:Uncharacterized protein n=1 Tax=Trifolium pratense TaxID=57577 RepID=A0ACB0KZG5_TRIPR|nr:unnamed protein product [Trifolium pratense]